MKTADVRSFLTEIKARPPGERDPKVDGLTPSLILEPENSETAGRALSFCVEEGLAVVPVGAGTRLHLGNVPSRLDCYLSTASLKGISHYEPGDLTLTAGAGTPLAEVQALTALERQFLPWDPPDAGRATLGGIVAAGEPGFRKRPGSRPRDLLLGLEALRADGTRFKAGGRVVKNVAGFELTKLLVGSLGTLAVLTAVHLRVRARPESTHTAVARFESREEIAEAVAALRRAALDPEVTAAVSPALAAALGLARFSLLLRFEGFEEEVRAASKRAGEKLAPAELIEPSDVESERIWDALRDFPSPAPGMRVVIRVQTLPSEVLRLETLESDFAVAYPDGGLVYVKSEEPERYAQIAAACKQSGGRAVLEVGPVDLKREIDVFGEVPEGLALMKRVKAVFDPKGTLAPGRGVGRI